MLPDERHPGAIEEVLDVRPPPGGEVVDDDDVKVLCQMRCSIGTEQEHRQGARCDCVCKVRADEAGPAGDDVAHEEVMAVGLFRGF